MALDVARLRDSGLASDETPESCWAALLLWCASWHQIPAASIPDNDAWVAKQTGYAQRGKISPDWQNVREGALRGWIKCSDGRLYHPVVAEKAMEAWNKKLDMRWKTELARIKKHNDRHQADVPKPSFEAWVADGCPVGHRLAVPEDMQERPRNVPRETASKETGTGTGTGTGRVLIPLAPSELVDADPADGANELVLTGEQEVLGPKFPPCPHAKIIALWREKLPALRQPRTWEGQRPVDLKARWIQASKPSDYSPDGYRTEAEGIKWWAGFFGYIATGTRLPAGFGSENTWWPDLEWVIKLANFQKIIDGNYDL